MPDLRWFEVLALADCCDCNQPGAETGARREIREGK